MLLVLSVSKFTANLYCLCICIDLGYTLADAVQVCGKFWDTPYLQIRVKTDVNLKPLFFSHSILTSIIIENSSIAIDFRGNKYPYPVKVPRSTTQGGNSGGDISFIKKAIYKLHKHRLTVLGRHFA